MRTFAHITCGEVVAKYLGDAETMTGLLMRSIDWEILGERPEPRSEMCYQCPKCGIYFGISPKFLIEV